MPRIIGVSSWDTCCHIRRSPRALTVPSCLGLSPMMLFTSVSLSLLLGTDRLLYQVTVATAPPDRVDRGLQDVVRVVRPQRLRQDVLHPGRLEHRAHGAAGDDPGARDGRL